VGGGDDERDLVRRGYDQLSYRYRSDDAEDGPYGPWLADLHRRLPGGSPVLDLGCGCGIPVARFLADRGHGVTGVDISDVQVDRARRLVPAAAFLRADAVDVRFPPGTFDAVVCLYALIHMPLAEQSPLLERIATWLRPGGWLLVTVGHEAWTGRQDAWLDGPAPMWWSQADAGTYRSWLERAGLTITSELLVPDGTAAHTLFWARKPGAQLGRPVAVVRRRATPVRTR
jgi:SAM-dependent methyltransferase